MNNKLEVGTGRIADIIQFLKLQNNVDSIREIPTLKKLGILCQVLQFTPQQLDKLIAHNSPALRTIKGHAFEVVFDYILTQCGHEVTEAGGDSNIDRIVNGKTLQLKTPYSAGTKGSIVSYKSHKTHGAKSERESLEYYSSIQKFPDYLVGLISYEPMRIIILDRSELPTHPNDDNRILSPFAVNWDGHPGLNAFHRIGVNNLDLSFAQELASDKESELLPLTAKKLDLKTDIIIDTILNESNFRIWDMNLRGFAREVYLFDQLVQRKIAKYNPVKLKPQRGDKADLALLSIETGSHVFFQVKGVSSGYCNFNGQKSIVGTETQLTRGRVNDHLTQSRLYLATDFDFLVLGIDPVVAQLYSQEIGDEARLEWQLYLIPTDDLDRHHMYPHRIKSVQRLLYTELQKYKVSDSWFDLWQKQLI
jgi:hypothetical protein